MNIAVNIGYQIKESGGGILSYFPLHFECDSFKVFAKDLRRKNNINTLFRWAKVSNVPPSSICLFLNVNDREIMIRMINVREYRTKWETKYKKKWEKITG